MGPPDGAVRFGLAPTALTRLFRSSVHPKATWLAPYGSGSPSGEPDPSRQDIELTVRLRQVGETQRDRHRRSEWLPQHGPGALGIVASGASGAVTIPVTAPSPTTGDKVLSASNEDSSAFGSVTVSPSHLRGKALPFGASPSDWGMRRIDRENHRIPNPNGRRGARRGAELAPAFEGGARRAAPVPPPSVLGSDPMRIYHGEIREEIVGSSLRSRRRTRYRALWRHPMKTLLLLSFVSVAGYLGGRASAFGRDTATPAPIPTSSGCCEGRKCCTASNGSNYCCDKTQCCGKDDCTECGRSPW